MCAGADPAATTRCEAEQCYKAGYDRHWRCVALRERQRREAVFPLTDSGSPLPVPAPDFRASDLGPPLPAQPPASPTARDPAEVCGGASPAATARCEAEQCYKAGYDRHPRCVALRERQRVEAAARNRAPAGR